MKFRPSLFWKKSFERLINRLVYTKTPFNAGAFMTGSTLGNSNMGEARSQLAAYQGHVYKCVTLIYRRAISVPFRLYKRREERQEQIKRHPFFELIKKPNPHMTGADLKAITFMHLDLTGKAFWLKVFNRIGRPVALWPISPGNFERFLFNDSKTELLKYMFKTEEGNAVQYDPEEIVYFRHPHPLYPLEGASPVQSQAFAHDIDRAIRVYQRNFFQQSARPDIVFETDQEISQEAAMRLLLGWKQNHQGVERAWEPAILSNGLKLKEISMTNEDLQFISLAGWAKLDILEAYNIPEQKLGTVKGGDLGTVRGVDITFNSECIKPRLDLYDEVINTYLLPHFDDGLFVRHENCIPRDREQDMRERESNLKTFTTTINEEREKMGLKPVPWGHAPCSPVGMAPMGLKASKNLSKFQS